MMAPIHTPGSFTKNFSFRRSYARLHKCTRQGFRSEPKPVSREEWRVRSGIRDSERQLIPLNYFLFSIPGIKHDYVAVDHFVEVALTRPYGADFAKLSLFAFHMAQSGRCRKTLWPDGRVAGWANDFIRQASSPAGVWDPKMFSNAALENFVNSCIDGEEVTKHKIFTNYRYMLWSAGVLVSEVLQPADLKQRWFVDAVRVFWDRQILSGLLPASANRSAFEGALLSSEIHKLMRCDEDQCRAFARAAHREYSPEKTAEQLDYLRKLGQIVA